MPFLSRAAVAAALLCHVSSGAVASELIYRPVNPSFGGNALNSSHLLGLANLQNKHQPSFGGGSASGLSQEDLFARQLESRLLSALSGDVVDAIFGDDPQQSGEVVFGDQTISFFRTLETTVIDIENAATGESTRIEIPNIQ